MRRTRYGMLIAVLVGVFGAVVAFAAPASAITWEHDTATAGTPPSTKTCVSTSGAQACFHADGDVWWVNDTASNGYAAEARWYDLRGETFTDDGTILFAVHRNGACVNGLGEGEWGKCDKDYDEMMDDLLWKACNVDSSGGLHGCTSGIGEHCPCGGSGSGSTTEKWGAAWPPDPTKLYYYDRPSSTWKVYS